MNYRIRITETAKQDLREIAFYIASQTQDRETAKKFVNELRAQCSRLAEFPNLGALPQDRMLRSMDYRFISHKDYLIFYRVNDSEKAVDILAVFNARKDFFRVMRRFL